MTTTKKVLKAGGRGVLTATIIATKCAKYGLSFTSGLVKQLFGGAQKMSNQFASGASLGIGSYLYESGEKVETTANEILLGVRYSF